MAFQFVADTAAAKSAGTGGSLDTGVHQVKITGAYLGTTKKGNNTVDLEFTDKSGAKGSIFGMCIDKTWVSGKENFDYSTWQELATVVGMQTGATVACKRKDFEGKEEDALAFTEIMGKDVTIAIQIEFDWYNEKNKESKKRNLYRTFFADGRSLAEVESNTPAKQSVALSTSLTDYITKALIAKRAANGGKPIVSAATNNTGANPQPDANAPAAEDKVPSAESLL